VRDHEAWHRERGAAPWPDADIERPVSHDDCPEVVNELLGHRGIVTVRRRVIVAREQPLVQPLATFAIGCSSPTFGPAM